MARQSGPPAVAVHGLVKSYPGVRALEGVSLSVNAGEVRALLGKNGAGKSTLVKIIAGAVRPDAGHVALAGEVVALASPADARSHGVAVVHQELSLVPGMTVAENLVLGRWRAVGGRGPLISSRAIARYARTLLHEFGVTLDPQERVSRLSPAQRQSVEIARALSDGTRVLILDEPTSSLPAVEVAALLSLVRRLAASGIAIIYVSHRMDEIHRVADSVSVLRDGRHIATRPAREVTTGQMVALMTGRAAPPPAVTRRAPEGPAVLSVSHLHSGDRVRDISFEVRRGEILGIAGLLGSGRTELLRCIYGLRRRDHGRVEVHGRPLPARRPRAAIRAGLAYAPEDRKAEGLALGMSVAGNLVLASLRRLGPAGLLSRRRELRIAEASRAQLRVKTPTVDTPVGVLSGGNQQKVVLGKWLNAKASILLLDEPTRGVDVEAKEHIYQLLRDIAGAGAGIVVVSSEIEELFLCCDRLLVLNSGRLVADLPVVDTEPPAVLALAMEGAPR